MESELTQTWDGILHGERLLTMSYIWISSLDGTLSASRDPGGWRA